jgi:DNA excision repair protein ERCC-2
MVRTLELQRLDEYASLQKVASFATLVATYEKGEPMADKTFT